MIKAFIFDEIKNYLKNHIKKWDLFKDVNYVNLNLKWEK